MMVKRSFRRRRLHLIIGVGEEEIHRLQRGARRLGVEGPDHHGVDQIEDRKDDVGLVSDVVESRRGDFDHDEVA